MDRIGNHFAIIANMALLLANRFPEYRQIILSIVISSTVFFELFGPLGTHIALKKAASSG